MQFILDTLTGHRGFSDWYTMSFYFFPVLLNAVAGSLMFFKALKSDYTAREKALADLVENEKAPADKKCQVYDYHKYLTIGDVMFWVFIGVCPVLSLWNVLWESFPYLADRLHTRFQWFFKIRFIRPPKISDLTEIN